MSSMQTIPSNFKQLSYNSETLQGQKDKAKKKQSLNNDSAVLNKKIIDTEYNIDDSYNSLLISKDNNFKERADELFSKNRNLNNNKNENNFKNNFKNTCIASTLLSGLTLGSTYLLKIASKKKAELPKWKSLPELPRNICLNQETHFATYVAIQNPSYKTIIGALGVFILGSIGCIGKNFVDGAKDIWIKKQESKVKENLQANLIDVETESFKGKVDYERELLSYAAFKFQDILKKPINKDAQNYHDENLCSKKQTVEKNNNINFKSNNETNNKVQIEKYKEKSVTEKKDLLYFLSIGGLTLLTVISCGILSKKNLQDTDKYFKEYSNNFKNQLKGLIKKVNPEYNIYSNISDSSQDLRTIKQMLITLQPNKSELDDFLANLNMEEKNLKKFKKEVWREIQKISDEGSEAIAGKPGNKACFYSHVDDVRGHLYNYIVNDGNPILGALFSGLCATTCFSYIGTQLIEAVKESEVIKTNAKTELNLQRNLINIDIENYKTKKQAAIEPLFIEFEKAQNEGRSKKELKTMAENILLEIKNGPPYIFS